LHEIVETHSFEKTGRVVDKSIDTTKFCGFELVYRLRTISKKKALTLKEHDNNSHMGSFPAAFAEAVKIVPHVKHSATSHRPVLTFRMACSTQFFAVGNL
jgi:hypothetical protein